MGNISSRSSGSNSRHPRSAETERPPPRPLLEPVHKGFNPTGQDVQVAAHILMGLQLQAPPGHLPPELALSILAHAGYQPRVTSSRADRWDYEPRGSRHWYLTTPMLPPDFRRVSSITLQVVSEERHQSNPMNLFPEVVVDPDDNNNSDSNTTDDDDDGTDGDEDEDHGHYTWFEMCILRPLFDESEVPEPVAEVPRRRRPRANYGMTDEDFWSDAPCESTWLQVNHNGRNPWVIRHHNRTPVIDSTPLRRCETYRVGWQPGAEDPEAFVDSGGFLSALMPGDKVAFWAAAKEPASSIAIKEAVMEILYDVST